MSMCNNCRSYAINIDKTETLCDVCYLRAEIDRLTRERDELSVEFKSRREAAVLAAKNYCDARQQIADLTRERDGSRAIVERLPKDASGNQISLRDVRYRANGRKIVVWKIVAEYVFGVDGLAYEPSSLYASPEAAEQARQSCQS